MSFSTRTESNHSEIQSLMSSWRAMSKLDLKEDWTFSATRLNQEEELRLFSETAAVAETVRLLGARLRTFMNWGARPRSHNPNRTHRHRRANAWKQLNVMSASYLSFSLCKEQATQTHAHSPGWNFVVQRLQYQPLLPRRPAYFHILSLSTVTFFSS